MNLTEKSIAEQFSFWHLALKESPEFVLAKLNPGVPVVVVGCGSSFYLSQSLAAHFTAHGFEAVAVPGSEWQLRPQNYVATTTGSLQVLLLSRSGESSETVAAARRSQILGHRVVGITCEAGSSLTTVTEPCVYLETHAAEGIVMTASASLMLLTGLRLAGTRIEASTIDAAQMLLEKNQAAFKTIALGRSHFVYLGGGALYGIANEGALKLMEMSLSYAQAYHPLEYRHGPVSLLDEKSLVVMLYSQDGFAEEQKLVKELQQKGAKVIGFGGPGDLTILLPESETSLHEVDLQETDLRCLLVLPCLQWLGECVAQAKGLDSRAPRHLTKVVTL